MNEELIYHQIETGSCRPVIAEFLIYDFRFWYDVETGFRIFGDRNSTIFASAWTKLYELWDNRKPGKAFKRRFMAGFTMDSRRKQTQIEDADLNW